jgi:hypothetical protein
MNISFDEEWKTSCPRAGQVNNPAALGGSAGKRFQWAGCYSFAV